ncbi:CinA family protein [Asanoa iriomotensis]|uniref:Competence damage-inducible protein A n=1 Tax=Asanoa iriomotensis TaxID=234613 RepID=A0ABQ4CAX7_9ACTN|nr:CinA family protein [Asanoa iriomotensis]GIF59913.1 competence damage-inducible protein A [Asanoa iriomotensis]
MTNPAQAVHLLLERKETLAVAESLTGGLLAATIVEVAGASAVFRGGLVAYATDLKATLVGVPEPLLEKQGPIDPDVALSLAEGARRTCRADWGIGTTGVAGPDSQDGKPVGLVYVAVTGPLGRQVDELNLDGGRASIRAGAVSHALESLVMLLRSPSANTSA